MRKARFPALVLACLFLLSACGAAPVRKVEYTSGPFHYSIRSDWHYEESETDGIHDNIHTRDRNHPDAGRVWVFTTSSPLASGISTLLSVPTVFDVFIDYDDYLLSAFIGGIASGLNGQLESSSPETFDHISGRVFSVFVESEDLHYAGFSAYREGTFFVMIYNDSRKEPEKLMDTLREELIPTIRVEE